MKYAFLICQSDFYYKNRVFDLNSPFNRDNAWHSMFALRKKFVEKKVELNTYDFLEQTTEEIEDEFYCLIFSDIPLDIDVFLKKKPNVDKYLLVLESIFINTRNGNMDYHQYFKKIFTYQDDLVDNKKYFKINYSFDIPKEITIFSRKKDKFCTLIAGNKTDVHPLEIYSKRIEAIRWFEKNHPTEFDLFGVGWNENSRLHAPRIFHLLHRYNIFPRPIERYFLEKEHYFPSYRGKIHRKVDVLKNYKFCICYENFRDVPGWITEKIFDCFFAGCVPVYWGAGNVTDHIPANCFIDKRDFNTYEELYDFMKKMTGDEYLEYQYNIVNFIKSDKIRKFSSEYFADTIANEVVLDQQKCS